MNTSPILILGPERSGTTLIYSILSNADEFYWLSRIDGALLRFPLLASWIRHGFEYFNKDKFFIGKKGSISRMNGVYTPSECVAYWNNYLFKYYKSDNGILDVTDVPRLGVSLKEDLTYRLKLSNKSGLLLKSPGFSLKMKFWKTLFPNARFVICTRDIQSNLKSYIAAKEKSKDPFWGTKIPNWKSHLTKNLYTQSLLQMQCTYSHILDALEHFNENDYYILDFDRFMNDPQEQSHNLCKFLGIKVNSKIQSAYQELISSLSEKYESYDNSQNKEILLNRMKSIEEELNNEVLKENAQLPQ